MTIIIEHKNKVVEFYDVPAEVANSIESLLHTIEIEKSDIISVESELDRKKKENGIKDKNSKEMYEFWKEKME